MNISNNDIVINQAVFEDIEKIKSLADSWIVKSLDARTGFFEYCLDLEQYKKRIENEFFLTGKKMSELVGFCLAYDCSFIEHLKNKEPLLKKDTVFSYLLNKENYVYIDQLAVKNPGSFINSKTAILLEKNICDLSLQKGLNTVILACCLSPWINKPTIKTIEHLGYKQIDVLKSKNVILGIYEKNLISQTD